MGQSIDCAIGIAYLSVARGFGKFDRVIEDNI